MPDTRESLSAIIQQVNVATPEFNLFPQNQEARETTEDIIDTISYLSPRDYLVMPYPAKDVLDASGAYNLWSCLDKKKVNDRLNDIAGWSIQIAQKLFPDGGVAYYRGDHDRADVISKIRSLCAKAQDNPIILASFEIIISGSEAQNEKSKTECAKIILSGLLEFYETLSGFKSINDLFRLRNRYNEIRDSIEFFTSVGSKFKEDEIILVQLNTTLSTIKDKFDTLFREFFIFLNNGESDKSKQVGLRDNLNKFDPIASDVSTDRQLAYLIGSHIDAYLEEQDDDFRQYLKETLGRWQRTPNQRESLRLTQFNCTLEDLLAAEGNRSLQYIDFFVALNNSEHVSFVNIEDQYSATFHPSILSYDIYYRPLEGEEIKVRSFVTDREVTYKWERASKMAVIPLDGLMEAFTQKLFSNLDFIFTKDGEQKLLTSKLPFEKKRLIIYILRDIFKMDIAVKDDSIVINTNLRVEFKKDNNGDDKIRKENDYEFYIYLMQRAFEYKGSQSSEITTAIEEEIF